MTQPLWFGIPGFLGVTGYDIYLTELDSSLFPYPGVVPPWLRVYPTTPVASLPLDQSYTFRNLGPDKFYAVNVVNQATSGLGEVGAPAIFPSTANRPPMPIVSSEYIFTIQGANATLTWEAPLDVNIDHFNIYRFPDSMTAKKVYHAFYDEGYSAFVLGIPPRDSFLVDAKKYLYYAVPPHAQVGANITQFSEPAGAEGTVYRITLVDRKGQESEFSVPVSVQLVERRTKEILVITNSTPMSSVALVSKDTIRAFYNSVLAGHDFDLYSYIDSTYIRCPSLSSDCFDWHDLSRYALVIIDDGMKDMIPFSVYEDTSAQVTKYLLSGGKLAYFGGFRGFRNSNVWGAPPIFNACSHKFQQRFFGIDSVFDVGANYYFDHSTFPYDDSLFGFHQAQAVNGAAPSLSYDSLHYPFDYLLRSYWPINTPPSVATFKVNDSGTVTHTYRAIYPSTSMNEGQPVGVKSVKGGAETYVFGFHLWYMDHIAARQLVEYMLGTGCCKDRAGNVDGDPSSQVDITDLMTLVGYLFVEAPAPMCRDAANVNGDLDGLIDISDLVALVDYLFFSGSLPACP